MVELTQANRQWASRSYDERYTNLFDMLSDMDIKRNNSREKHVSIRQIEARPSDDNRGIEIHGPNGVPYAPSHWAFGQLAARAEAPAGYLRTLPAPMAADCINYGLKFKRNIDEIAVLLDKSEAPIIRAATGPRYGRIWNSDIVRKLIDTFGDGVNGQFTVPAEFGIKQTVSKENTTLFAGDRDMFVFLANETNRIELKNRRDGKTGTLARGFFVWNSEVGAATFGVQSFLFDYVCSNRIVWGAQDVKKITVRHTSAAPDRFIEQIAPALLEYSNSSVSSVTTALNNAQNSRFDSDDKLTEFLSARFGKREGEAIKAAHMIDEGRPIETIWDAVTGATAYARNIQWQDERVAVEREAGKILDLVAA